MDSSNHTRRNVRELGPFLIETCITDMLMSSEEVQKIHMDHFPKRIRLDVHGQEVVTS